jgi:nitrogen regulatory protein P-II 2
MSLVELKLVTIVSERILRSQIIDHIIECGAKGYTITEASGEGSRGIRASEFEGRNIKFEIISSSEVAEKIFQIIKTEYFENYAVIVYSQDVKVVRGKKYI